ncbi:MAG: hypothetical protein R2856_26270 [Caldilineaceae bacterium]
MSPAANANEELITAGRVQVDSNVITETRLQSGRRKGVDHVDGKPVTQPKHVYIKVHKPHRRHL